MYKLFLKGVIEAGKKKTKKKGKIQKKLIIGYLVCKGGSQQSQGH